jgi:C4-dicarboxylate-specific signal transduction histidine kinase
MPGLRHEHDPMSGGDVSPRRRAPHRGPGGTAAAFLPLAIVAGLVVFGVLSAVKSAEEARLSAATRALAAAVDTKLGAAITTLQALGSSLVLEPEPQQAMVRFREIGDELGGPILLLSPPSDQSPQPADNGSAAQGQRPRFAEEMATALRVPIARVFVSGQPVVSDLVTSSAHAQPIVAAVVPVMRGGKVRYVLALLLEPAGWQALLARQQLEAGSFAIIRDAQLRLLASSRDPDGRRTGSPAPDWLAAAIEGRPHAQATGRDAEGIEGVYAAVRPVLAPGWIVAVGQSQALQRLAMRRAIYWMLGGGAALGLGIAIAVWASRRAALREARREADLLRAGRAEVLRLLDGLPAVIFHREMRRDGSARLLYRGGDFEGVTGWPATDLTSENALRRHAYPGDTPLGDIAEALWRDGQASFQWRMLQPDGSVRWLNTLVRVLQRRGDDCMEIIGYSLNITAEQDAKARALGAAKLASLGEMAAGLAHELKQPLQSVSLAAEIGMLATARHDHAEITRRFATIVGQAQRASYLIERLRRFSIGSGTGIATEDVQLAATVEGALLLTGSALSRAGVTVEVALGEPAPVIRGEAVLLEQVFTNLLLNAADALAAQPPDAPRRVRIAAESGAGGMVRITVADTGGGIPADILGRIFEPFVTTKGPDKGTGLGLSICHGLITGMGGTIEARNAAAGAVFVLTLAAASAPRPS